MMRLKPSDIMFSQESVNNFFDKRSRHSEILIGETLDDICEGRCNINDIPTIRVMKRDGKWVTADNRRLWVFRELERLGKCYEIPVNETYYIPFEKLNSENGGVTVRVRRHAGGHWHNKRSAPNPGPKKDTHPHNSTRHASNTSNSGILESAFPKPSIPKASSAYATRQPMTSQTDVPLSYFPMNASNERHVLRGTTFNETVDEKSGSACQNSVAHGFKETTTTKTSQNRGQNPVRPKYSGLYVTNPSFNPSSNFSYVEARQKRNDAVYPYFGTDDTFLISHSEEIKVDSNTRHHTGQPLGKNGESCVEHAGRQSHSTRQDREGATRVELYHDDGRQSHSTRQDREGATRVELYHDDVVSGDREQCPCTIL